MCLPFFTLAFCAVFAPAPAHSHALAPAVAVTAVASAAATPAREPGSGQATRSQGARGGTQKEGVVLAVAQTAVDRRESSSSRAEAHDTESKGDRGSAQEAGAQGDTEAK